MSASQRVSRGFHRLGFLLAAIPLLIGTYFSIVIASSEADKQNQHDALLCAHRHLQKADKELAGNPFWPKDSEGDERLNLKQIGCSDSTEDTVSFAEARNFAEVRNPATFGWLSGSEWLGVFVPPAAAGLAITLAVTLAVYGIVRAIGWVIGGFAA